MKVIKSIGESLYDGPIYSVSLYGVPNPRISQSSIGNFLITFPLIFIIGLITYFFKSKKMNQKKKKIIIAVTIILAIFILIGIYLKLTDTSYLR